MYNGRDFFNFLYSEAVAQTCSVKKVFLEILQNSQESTCARVSFLIKLQALPASLLKKRLWRRCFPLNFAKFLRTSFFREHLWWLLLFIQPFPSRAFQRVVFNPLLRNVVKWSDTL